MTGEEIARELGIHYDGYQKGIGMQFTDIQQTGSTFYAGTLEIARTKLAKRRELFGQADRPAIGTCYHDAWRYVARHTEDQPVLVHGTIVGIYGRMGHAWVELPDGTVYDAASQVTMPIEKYYSLVDPIVEDRYTADEAMHMLSVGKHGPWSAEDRMKHIGR